MPLYGATTTWSGEIAVASPLLAYASRVKIHVRTTLSNIMEVDSPQRPHPMTDNITAGNVIEIMSSPVQPAPKRKGEDRARHEGKENGDDKRVKLDCESDVVILRLEMGMLIVSGSQWSSQTTCRAEGEEIGLQRRCSSLDNTQTT